MDSEYGELVPWTSGNWKQPRKAPRRAGRPTNIELGRPPAAPRLTPEENRAENSVLFRRAVSEWIDADSSIFFDKTEVGENAYLLRVAGHKRAITAAEWGRLAASLPGQILPLPDHAGCVWMKGAGVGWLLTKPKMVSDALTAQRLYLETVPSSERKDAPLPFTQGALAGRFLRWVGVTQAINKHLETYLAHPGGSLAYFRAIPGRYENMVQWDVSAFYYSLIAKMPSPLVSILPDRAVWQLVEPEQLDRWQRSITAIGDHKALRNALWGKMCGSRDKEKRELSFSANFPGGLVAPPRLGNLRLSGLLIARIGHELTQRQALEGNAVWSHTDAVIMPYGVEPSVWRNAGLTVRQVNPAPPLVTGAPLVGASDPLIGASAHIATPNDYEIAGVKKGAIVMHQGGPETTSFVKNDAGEWVEDPGPEAVWGTALPETFYSGGY